MPIVLASIVGFIVSLVSGVQSEASVRVFILGTSYASLVLSILVIVWFFLVLPASKEANPQRRNSKD
jgi:VIT1/CCC1 family predicted Fe2+/Mn2+ transporter